MNLGSFRVDAETILIATHILSALVAGGLIGLERNYHGRPAGFRTHALVCVASSLLMLVTVFQGRWMDTIPLETIRTDPTRMAQGIMTGIGFLGAGVIYQEGFTIRGLTTAASIWITAVIGILYGIGFYYPAILATGLTLGVLSVFRWIEIRLPSQVYVHHHIAFERDHAMSEPDLRKMLGEQGFMVVYVSYRLTNDGRWFEYRTILRTLDGQNTARLADTLCHMPNVRDFRISPAND
jgi:putative Mg2+ transporter-C (MgtC) family protein